MIPHRAVLLLDHLHPVLDTVMNALPNSAAMDLEDAVTDGAFRIEHSGDTSLLTAAAAPHPELAAAVAALLKPETAPLQRAAQQHIDQ